MKRRPMFLLLVAACLCLTAQVLAAPINLTFQHNSSTGHTWQAGAEFMARELAVRTDGQVSMTIYPAGVLAGRDWKRMLEQVQTGVVDMMIEFPGAYATLVDEIWVMHTPFLFDDMDHFDRFRYDIPPQLQAYFDKLEDYDVTLVGLWPRPFRQHVNSRRPIRTPEDLKGIKLRMPAVSFFLDTAAALGIEAIPLASGEIYTAIQLGTVDGEDNSINIVYDFKTYEVARYFTVWDYIPDAVLVVMNSAKWASLPPDIQKTIREVAMEAGDLVLKLEKEHEVRNIERMKQEGVSFTFLTEQEKEPFREMVVPIWDKMRATLGAEDFDAIIKAIDAKR
ncbi:MAG: TRAP transporter substrate-binding protein [Limnochordia bacterium]|jgi:tripartite ATP-independent transporter DctP family solute receptor|nr:TRAP transporter substrate-binding protein [Bacillota bacterium]